VNIKTNDFVILDIACQIGGFNKPSTEPLQEYNTTQLQVAAVNCAKSRTYINTAFEVILEYTFEDQSTLSFQVAGNVFKVE
jgi:hypothetical protein